MRHIEDSTLVTKYAGLQCHINGDCSNKVVFVRNVRNLTKEMLSVSTFIGPTPREVCIKIRVPLCPLFPYTESPSLPCHFYNIYFIFLLMALNPDSLGDLSGRVYIVTGGNAGMFVSPFPDCFELQLMELQWLLQRPPPGRASCKSLSLQSFRSQRQCCHRINQKALSVRGSPFP